MITGSTLQHLGRVRPCLFLDDLECLRLSAAVVLDGRTDHAARIGYEIRNVDDAPIVQHPFRTLGYTDVGALDDQLGLDDLLVILGYHIRPRCRHPDVTVDGKDRIAAELLAARVVEHAAALVLDLDHLADVEATRLVHRSFGIRGGNDNRASFHEETRRMLAYRTKPLDSDARPVELRPTVFLRHFGRYHDAVTGRPDLIQRNPTDYGG